VVKAVLLVVLRSDGLDRMNPLRREETSACAPIKTCFRRLAVRQSYIAGEVHVGTAYLAIQADVVYSQVIVHK
jgi:hypothetical protein